MTAELKERIGIDESMNWQPHFERMSEFWSSVALMTGVYHGRPMQKHLPLPVDGRHFDRWLELFRQSAREVCPAVAADHFIERVGAPGP